MSKIEGECGLFSGSSRMGKTTALIQHLTEHAPGDRSRILVFSIKEQIDGYAGALKANRVLSTPKNLLAGLEQLKGGPGIVVYTPRELSEFAFFCRAAHWWAKQGHAAGVHTSIVAEELADVTTPAKAPPGWGELVRQGMGWGANVYGVSQRPAESDKTIMGNATFFHAHRLARRADRRTIAEEMDTDEQTIARLAKYEWIERWAGEPELREGTTSR